MDEPKENKDSKLEETQGINPTMWNIQINKKYNVINYINKY